jgi:hypothetical protein
MRRCAARLALVEAIEQRRQRAQVADRRGGTASRAPPRRVPGRAARARWRSTSRRPASSSGSSAMRVHCCQARAQVRQTSGSADGISVGA